MSVQYGSVAMDGKNEGLNDRVEEFFGGRMAGQNQEEGRLKHYFTYSSHLPFP